MGESAQVLGPLESLDDVALHHAVLAGTPGARGQFYLRHVAAVLRWSTRLGGRGVDPEGVTHEVFIVALEKICRFRPGRFEPWLFAITRRVLANHRRRARAREVWSRLTGVQQERMRPPADDPLDASLRNEQRSAVFQCLDALSVKHREVLVLCVMEGRTAVEVAAMLGVPQGTVYTRLHYAKDAFRQASERGGLLDLLAGAEAAAGSQSRAGRGTRRERS